jgi:hypothetical protein
MNTLKHQQNLLAIHRQNVAIYLREVAMYGPTPPVHLVHAIAHERERIALLKQKLRTQGVDVLDLLDDIAPPPV